MMLKFFWLFLSAVFLTTGSTKEIEPEVSKVEIISPNGVWVFDDELIEIQGAFSFSPYLLFSDKTRLFFQKVKIQYQDKGMLPFGPDGEEVEIERTVVIKKIEVCCNRIFSKSAKIAGVWQKTRRDTQSFDLEDVEARPVWKVGQTYTVKLASEPGGKVVAGTAGSFKVMRRKDNDDISPETPKK